MQEEALITVDQPSPDDLKSMAQTWESVKLGRELAMNLHHLKVVQLAEMRIDDRKQAFVEWYLERMPISLMPAANGDLKPRYQFPQGQTKEEQQEVIQDYTEDNNAQALMVPLYKTAFDDYDKRFLITGVTQTENKYERISTLEPEITNGYLLFADNLNPRLMEQLTLFPTSEDDGPDALQGAVSQLSSRARIRRRGGRTTQSGLWVPPW